MITSRPKNRTYLYVLEKLLDQLTIEEMALLIGKGAFETQYIPSIEKPPTKDFGRGL